MALDRWNFKGSFLRSTTKNSETESFVGKEKEKITEILCFYSFTDNSLRRTD